MVQTETIQHAVGVFPTKSAAEAALAQLQERQFPLEQVAVVAQRNDDDTHLSGVAVQASVGNRAGQTATTGATVGGIGGAVVGAFEALGASTTLALLPGAGQVLLFGTVAANALATAVLGGAAGAAGGGLLGGLLGWGVPEKQARLYQDHVVKGQYLLMLEGTQTQIQQAESILNPQSIRDWNVYDLKQA